MSRKELLYKLGRFLAENCWKTLIVCLLATVGMGALAAHLEINLGFLALLDENDPEVKYIRYANENFGGMDYIFVAVTADDLYEAKKLADHYADALRKNEMILRVVHKIDTDELSRFAFMFMEPEQIKDFEKLLSENQPDLINAFKDVRATPFLTALNQGMKRQIIEKDEISDPDQAKDQLQGLDDFVATLNDYLEQGEKIGQYPLKKALRGLFAPQSDKDDSVLSDEYMLSLDGRTLLMLVMPSEPGDDLEFTSQIMAFMEKTAAELSNGIAGATIDIAGNIPITRDEHRAMVKDMKVSSVVTMILALIIFFVFFRRLSDLALIGFTLGAGVIWTYAVTYLYIGFLGVTTAFFSAILIGLGIDFAIHIIARYGERLRNGDDVVEAIAQSLSGAGPGILTGALTTSAAFFTLMICRFKGISQLGFVAGSGIVSMMILMFTLLPALLTIRDTKLRRKGPLQVKETFTLSKLSSFMVRHQRIALFVIFAVTVVMGVAATQVRFNYDFRSLEPRDGQAIKANHRLEAKFGKSIDYGLLFADSVEESRLLAKEILAKSSIKEVLDISEFIPLDQETKQKMAQQIIPLLEPVRIEISPGENDSLDSDGTIDFASALRQSRQMVLAVKQLAILGGEFEIEDQCTKVMADLDETAKKIETRPEYYSSGASYFQKALGIELEKLLGNLKLAAKGEVITPEKLPQTLKDNYIGKDGKFLVYAYPDGYLWEREMLMTNRDDLRSVTGKSTSIGLAFLALINKIKLDFQSAVWLSLGMVFLLVFIDFRRLTTALMALIPLIIGALWMVGTMVLLGLSFNLVNVAVVPLIIGIGIDNGVHIIHRYRSEPTDKVRQAVQHTGRAIFLSSITTVAGFGSLGLASYIMVATLGWVLVIGVTYCFLTSVIVLPIILSIVETKVAKI